MKKTVWTFGLISGAILSVMMLATIPFHDAVLRYASDKTDALATRLKDCLLYYAIKTSSARPSLVMR